MSFAGFGPVKIVPAQVFRQQQQEIQRQQDQYYNLRIAHQNPRSIWHSVATVQQQQPENAAYYAGAAAENAAFYAGGASTSAGVGGHHPLAGAYSHEPYGQNAYIEGSYQGGGVFPSSFAYGTMPFATYTPFYPPNGQPSSSYRAYPQPSPPYRRSRTAPNRTIPRNPPGPGNYYPSAARRPRGVSMDPDRRAYRAYLAPGKKPPQMYRKRRSNYQETSFVDYPQMHTLGRDGYVMDGGATLRRPRPYYTPSYTTYPPSTMHRTKERNNKYPLFARLFVKMVQMLLGAAILGLVLGPMRATSFIDFVTRTRTEWQGAVVGIVSVLEILTGTLIFSAFCGYRSNAWKKVDAHISIAGILLYLLSACIEAYYAACYPPDGPRINLVCHRAEWIIATVLLFANVVMYIVDFVLTWMSGVTML